MIVLPGAFIVGATGHDRAARSWMRALPWVPLP